MECHQLVKSEDDSQLKIIEFSPDGEVLLTGTSDKHIALWSTGDWSIATKRCNSSHVCHCTMQHSAMQSYC